MWVPANGTEWPPVAPASPNPHFPLPRRWLSDTWTRPGLLSKLPSPRCSRNTQNSREQSEHHAASGPRRPKDKFLRGGVPQPLCPVSPHARKSGTLVAREPAWGRKFRGGGPRRGKLSLASVLRAAPFPPPRPAPAGAVRPLRPCARGRSGAAGQREPQSALARRPAGMLRYSSGLTVTATTPRRPSGDGGRARRKVRGAVRAGGG